MVVQVVVEYRRRMVSDRLVWDSNGRSKKDKYGSTVLFETVDPGIDMEGYDDIDGDDDSFAAVAADWSRATDGRMGATPYRAA